MAVNTTVHQFSPERLQFLLLLLFVLTFSATPLTFNFSSFPANTRTLFLEGDASIDGSLRLTKSALDDVMNMSTGRATFGESFLLRQNEKLADFTSSFTFSISSTDIHGGDGLVFFIAPNGSLLLDKASEGGCNLGLPVNTKRPKFTTRYSFVAVEFDIYPNGRTSGQPTIEDPDYDHVGIDINSVKSYLTTEWNGGIIGGKQNNATISYDSSSKNLSVAFTTFKNVDRYSRVQVIKKFYCLIDLLQYLPDRVIVGFSASTGTAVAVHKIIAWNFTSTLLVDDNSTNNNPLAGNSTTTSDNNVGLAVGLGVGGCVTLVGALALVRFIFCTQKRGTAGESTDDGTLVLHDPIPDEFEKGTGPRKFSYNELADATNNFAEGEKLGQGGFGGVYRGCIDLNSYVAVKKISPGSKQGLKEYVAEVNIISRLRHRNLVQLIGWCHEKELLLVYKYMPNGSLDAHLFKEESLLTWEVRYKIAHGLASGLLYLHQEWEQCVLHRDIKSSNVMLDSNFNAKLGDFGLARLVDHGKKSQTTVVAGTMGYMAMEYVTTGKASNETDVYSFGVVALEIACGRKPIDSSYEEKQINMVEWVWELYGDGKIIEAADPKLRGDFDVKQMECLMMVGLWCAHPDYNFRPLIQKAIQVLNFEVPLPDLPPKMPMAFGLPSSLSTLSNCNTT
ncbi:putative protein kinase RLK-Pelle-L-LEC family [Rosa chinensis]|uniref:Protein kinase domain-containing protein n=1 Tax=Rosa chinensis TaxID=74649 RepID=A0A2P6QAC7_ROSCH|nr:L-type lectin-domain containing receptor kinase IX.1 [Rosa chinensis]PRQ31130.1 putative protein kinase RLK-Pelle-L-LEC family [Rosa chinensis]